MKAQTQTQTKPISEKVEIIPKYEIGSHHITIATLKIKEDINCDELDELEQYIVKTLVNKKDYQRIVKIGDPGYYDYDLYLATLEICNEECYYLDLLVEDGNRILEDPYFEAGEELDIYLFPAPYQRDEIKHEGAQ